VVVKGTSALFKISTYLKEYVILDATLVFIGKSRCIHTQNHDHQCSDLLAARQQHNDIILKKEHDRPDEKLEYLDSLYLDGPFNTFN